MIETMRDAKLRMYRAGHYSFDPALLCGQYEQWTDDDWIRYIDRHGRWHRWALADVNWTELAQTWLDD